MRSQSVHDFFHLKPLFLVCPRLLTDVMPLSRLSYAERVVATLAYLVLICFLFELLSFPDTELDSLAHFNDARPVVVPNI